jgi:hypothetical protein
MSIVLHLTDRIARVLQDNCASRHLRSMPTALQNLTDHVPPPDVSQPPWLPMNDPAALDRRRAFTVPEG